MVTRDGAYVVRSIADTYGLMTVAGCSLRRMRCCELSVARITSIILQREHDSLAIARGILLRTIIRSFVRVAYGFFKVSLRIAKVVISPRYCCRYSLSRIKDTWIIEMINYLPFNNYIFLCHTYKLRILFAVLLFHFRSKLISEANLSD